VEVLAELEDFRMKICDAWHVEGVAKG